MKNFLILLLFFEFISTLSWGQDSSLPIFQVPVYRFGIKNGMNNSVTQDVIPHKSGFLEILDGSHPKFIIGNEIMNFNHEHYKNFTNSWVSYSNNSLISLTESSLQFWDYNSMSADTILDFGINKIVLYDNSDEFIFLYLREGAFQVYDYKGNLQYLYILNENEEHITLKGNLLFLKNKKTKQIHVIDGIKKHSYEIDFYPENPFMVEILNDNFIIIMVDNHLKLFDLEKNQLSEIVKSDFDTKFLVLESCFWKEEKYILNFGLTLVIFDLGLKKITHEIRNQKNEMLLSSGIIKFLKIDKNEFLYCQTIRHGVLKCDLKNSIFRINNARKSEQFAKNVVVDSEMDFILYTNWFNNLIIHNKSGVFLHEISFNDIQNKLAIGVSKISKGKYLVLFEQSHQHKILTFKNQENYEIQDLKSNDKTENGYFAKEIENDNDKIVIHIEGELVIFNKKTSKLTFHKFLPKINDTRTAGLIEGNFYVQLGYYLYEFLYPKMELIDSIRIEEYTIVRDIIKGDEGKLLIAHNNGLFELDLETKTTSSFENIKECIYSIEYFEDNYYLGTNNGILVVNNRKIIDRIALQDEFTDSEFNTNAKLKTEEALYFGSTSGIVVINKFYAKLNSEVTIKPFRITIEQQKELYFVDSLELNKPIKLKEDESTLEIIFANLSPYFHDNIIYQYSLNDKAENWENLKKSYNLTLNLSPGKYKLYYAGSRFFNKSIEKKNFISIYVKAKWYNTLFFRILIISSIIGVIAYLYIRFINFRNQGLINTLSLEKQIEHDKNRIAMDLHDNIGVNLSILKRNLDFISENNTKLSNEEIIEKVDFLSEVSGEVGQALRDSIWAVRREKFTLYDMITRVESLVKSFEINSKKQEIIVIQDLKNPEVSFGPTKILNLYRIIQEAINNAVKHSGASRITVSFSNNKDFTLCSIEDNGMGFDPKNTTKSGLKNMEIRAKNEDFLISIDSSVNHFTNVVIQINNE